MKAYKNTQFLDSADARLLRIVSEFVEPQSRFAHHEIEDTIVFMGSARAPSPEDEHPTADVVPASPELMTSAYDACRDLARRLTDWSKNLPEDHRRFVVCSGGGPGIMEAANRGASDAGGINVGLGISLPHEQANNHYITRELSLEFHYFFMRKFWFVSLAKAIIVFPGGFGTMDELFDVLTLNQTGKLSQKISIVLFGTDYWNSVLNLGAMVDAGTISPADLDHFHQTDDIDDAFDYVTCDLSDNAMDCPGIIL